MRVAYLCCVSPSSSVVCGSACPFLTLEVHRGVPPHQVHGVRTLLHRSFGTSGVRNAVTFIWVPKSGSVQSGFLGGEHLLGFHFRTLRVYFSGFIALVWHCAHKRGVCTLQMQLWCTVGNETRLKGHGKERVRKYCIKNGGVF